MKKIYHTCFKCNATFSGRMSRKYCSRLCADSIKKIPWNKGLKGMAANRKKEGKDVICKQCNKSFYVQKSRAGADKAAFCSTNCYMQSRWSEGGKCKNCGIDCTARFCSFTCQKSYWCTHGFKAHAHKNYWKRKLKIMEELGGKCVKCGIDDFRILEIDHIDPSKKIRPKDRQYTWLRRFKDWEANKGNLRLLCANCHRLHTWEQRGFGFDGITNIIDK